MKNRATLIIYYNKNYVHVFSHFLSQYLELLWVTDTTESEPVDKADFCRELIPSNMPYQHTCVPIKARVNDKFSDLDSFL